jgi:ppGpp synthetase/RelA/SpoT-type nucleotidyltranferase
MNTETLSEILLWRHAMKQLIKDQFLNKYHLDEKMLIENNIDWGKLNDIYNHFIEIRNNLITQAEFVASTLRTNEKIHTVRSRVKDPEHLMEKLIRKTSQRKEKHGEDFQFTVDNYLDEITDLIGVRAIHIFKEDWEEIHQFIKNTWNVIETTANVRDGDDVKRFNELDVKIDSRHTGYRSVHYLIEFFPTNKRVVAEIQVRTIFEEGYGEIDHQLRYPHGQVPEVLALNLLLFNRIAGSADEMASFINMLKRSWTDMEEKYESIINDKNNEIEELKNKIENSNLEKSDKSSLLSSVAKINTKNEFLNKINKIYLNNSYNDTFEKYSKIKFEDNVSTLTQLMNSDYFKTTSKFLNINSDSKSSDG